VSTGLLSAELEQLENPKELASGVNGEIWTKVDIFDMLGSMALPLHGFNSPHLTDAWVDVDDLEGFVGEPFHTFIDAMRGREVYLRPGVVPKVSPLGDVEGFLIPIDCRVVPDVGLADDSTGGGGQAPTRDSWLPLTDAARRLSRCTRTLRRWRLAGHLADDDMQMLGGRWMVRESAIERLVDPDKTAVDTHVVRARPGAMKAAYGDAFDDLRAVAVRFANAVRGVQEGRTQQEEYSEAFAMLRESLTAFFSSVSKTHARVSTGPSWKAMERPESDAGPSRESGQS
jgi:hypothetical protein